MRLAAYLARVTTLDPQALSPRQAIDLATRGVAHALGEGGGEIGDGRWEIGRLEIGAAADLVVLDLDAAHIQPVGNPLASVVYNARGSDVDTVIVDGRELMRDKRVLMLDEAALLDECRARAARLAERAAARGQKSEVRSQRSEVRGERWNLT